MAKQGAQKPQASTSFQQMAAGLKSIKVKAPNKNLSTTSHKSGLPKIHESES